MERAKPFLDVRNLTKVYPSLSIRPAALDEIHLQVWPGELVAVMGRSGSGKSTLLNMLSGIDRPSRGEVHVNEVALHALSEAQLTAWRGQNVGIVFQFFQLMPTLTLVENVMLPMELNGRYSQAERRERAFELCARVDMAAQSDKLPSMVSGGEQQRVALARALANDPPFLLADEPTGNLDSATAVTIFRLLEGQAEDGKTVILLTHDTDLAARAHRTLRIQDGRIVGERRG